jgi:hypothetical protein
MSQMPRDVAARLGHETLAILLAGGYVSPGSVRVDITSQIDRAVKETREYVI